MQAKDNARRGRALAAILLCPAAAWPAASFAQTYPPSPPPPPPPLAQPVPLGAVASAPTPYVRPPPLELTGVGTQETADCAGQPARVDGDGNNVTLRGGCASLTIVGHGNRVQMSILPGSQISMHGSGNIVTFALASPGPDPLVTVEGEGNHAWRVRALGAAGEPIEISPRGVAVQGAPTTVVTELPTEQTPQGLLVRLSNDVLFAFDSAQLRPEAQTKLMQLADLIRQTRPEGLSIVGNADSIGTDAYNMNLSLRRAQAVQNWLVTQGGVHLADIQVSGDGDHNPVAPNKQPNGRDNPAGRALNRRVDITLEPHGNAAAASR